jgi:hypothetical protein
MNELTRPLMYYLDEQGEPVGVWQLDAFGDPRVREWYEHAWEPGPRSKRVAQNDVDGYWVSTVFLLVDHQYGDGPPVLWETMVFSENSSGSDLYCERYTSREAAEQGHARVVAELLSGKTPGQIRGC